MTLLESISARHSVRAYRQEPVAAQVRQQLDEFVAQVNAESGLDIAVMYDDPAGFDSRMAHYGKFSGVQNYIILKGKKTADFDYVCGYYGEKIVLFAQQLGLNTCWTAMTFNKKRVKELVPAGQELCMAISLGYGATQGVQHKSKALQDVVNGTVPESFIPGIEAALLAPTAMNQQKFVFSENGGRPVLKVKGMGFYTMVDLGIVAYHFEAVTGLKVRNED